MKDLQLSQGSGGLWSVRDQWASPDGTVVRVCFAGKGLPKERRPAVEAVVPEHIECSWLQQIHSGIVVSAEVGSCGEGDALVSSQPRRALSVVTADCVPVLLAGGGRVAAVHAGWRGVVAEIVGATVACFQDPVRVAWIGPAISVEAYEVGREVAESVAAVSGPEVIHEIEGRRPHVDLRRAVAIQLRQAGVQEIRTVAGCTLGDEESLWSYRRDGAQAGRNLSVIWRD